MITMDYTTKELEQALSAIQTLLDLEIGFDKDAHNAIMDALEHRKEMDKA